MPHIALYGGEQDGQLIPDVPKEHPKRVIIDQPTAHELLWAADLVAWAYGAGGWSRSAISHLVTVHDLR